MLDFGNHGNAPYNAISFCQDRDLPTACGGLLNGRNVTQNTPKLDQKICRVTVSAERCKRFRSPVGIRDVCDGQPALADDDTAGALDRICKYIVIARKLQELVPGFRIQAAESAGCDGRRARSA